MTDTESRAHTPSRVLDVLVVDDDPLILTVVDLMVRHAGHRARTVPDASSALDAMVDAPVDVVVSDIRMPGMDGIALARVVRQDYPNVPIILMTGYLSDYSSGNADHLGVEQILKKPFKSGDLIDAIRRAVGK